MHFSDASMVMVGATSLLINSMDYLEVSEEKPDIPLCWESHGRMCEGVLVLILAQEIRGKTPISVRSFTG